MSSHLLIKCLRQSIIHDLHKVKKKACWFSWCKMRCAYIWSNPPTSHFRCSDWLLHLSFIDAAPHSRCRHSWDVTFWALHGVCNCSIQSVKEALEVKTDDLSPLTWGKQKVNCRAWNHMCDCVSWLELKIKFVWFTKACVFTLAWSL